MKALRRRIAGVCLLCAGAGLWAQAPHPKEKVAIVSPSHSPDSRGEIVYEVQGETQRDVLVVPGVLVDPKPLSMPKPKYSKEMKKARFEGEVTLEGTITMQGEVIDLAPVGTADAEAEAAAMAAVRQYRLKPAMLDGKPIAYRFRVVVNFRIR